MEWVRRGIGSCRGVLHYFDGVSSDNERKNKKCQDHVG